MKDKYIVIYTDHGDSTDGLARILGTYDSEEDAIKAMNSDHLTYLNENESAELISESHIHVHVEASNYGCTWQILHIKI